MPRTVKNSCLEMLAMIAMVASSDGTQSLYLGSPPTKAYFFPWLVTFHRSTPTGKTFFGSGSIITHEWVVGSMDCFIRPNDDRKRIPFYHNIKEWEVHSGGIWATAFDGDVNQPTDSTWLQVRKVDQVHVLSNPDQEHSKRIVFSDSERPSNKDLNSARLSPYGFSMSIAVIKVKKVPGSGTADGWEWKRTSLPIQLMASDSGHLRELHKNIIEYLEQETYVGLCHVGGWRPGDWRLVDHEVVYIPFEQCQDMYCAEDSRACMTWPVQGVHVCFKSTAFTEPCWRDQGSALYCSIPQLVYGVVGILTSAPSCGLGGLPGVYTLAEWGLDLLSKAPGSEDYSPIPMSDRDKYTPPPNEDLVTIN